MVFKESGGRRVVQSRKMDAMRHTLPRLQLTVPMSMRTGKVGYHWGALVHPGDEKWNIWEVLLFALWEKVLASS